MKTLSGFTLLEIAIALGIIGSMSLPMIHSLYKQKKDHQTEQNLNQVTQALAAYVLAYKHLPCHANPQADPDREGLSEDNRVIGLVLYRTLGLPETVGKNGYRYWLTYAVPLELTNQSIRHLMTENVGEEPTSIFCEISHPMIFLNVINEVGQPVLSADIQNDLIAFVLG